MKHFTVGVGNQFRNSHNAAALVSRAETKSYQGRIIKRAGDRGLIEFRSMVDAVRCAIGAQIGLLVRDASAPHSSRYGGAGQQRRRIHNCVTKGNDSYGEKYIDKKSIFGDIATAGLRLWGLWGAWQGACGLGTISQFGGL